MTSLLTAIRTGVARALALDYDACARFTSDVLRFVSALATGGRASRPPGGGRLARRLVLDAAGQDARQRRAGRPPS